MAATSPDPATPSPVATRPGAKARQALALMLEALDLIDSNEEGGVAGAHLDLAIHRLQEWVDGAAR